MIDIKNKSIFLSGPMSGIENYNVEAFCEAHAKLKKFNTGYVYNPAIAYLCYGDKHMTHEHWMEKSIKELLAGIDGFKYDYLIQLDGWEDSDGARLEAEVAGACGIKVVSLAEVLGE